MKDDVFSRTPIANDAPRGFAYLLLSVLLISIGLHLTRAAMEGSTPLTVSLIHGLTTVVVFFLLGWFWRRSRWTAADLHHVNGAGMRRFIRAHAVFFLPAPLLLALNSWMMNTSMNRYGTEMTAFLANLTLVFLVAAGWLAGERTSRKEAMAIVLMIGGAFLFSYQGGSIAWGAIALMTGACAIIAGKQLLVKHTSRNAPLPIAMCAVMALSLPWTVFLLLLTGQGHWPPQRTIALSVLAAVLTSVVGMGLLYRGYHLIGVTRGAPFNALRPLVVLLLGLAFGHAMPTTLQMSGGLMILTGSIVLTGKSSYAKKS